MKAPEYHEGPQALENFKQFAGEIFQSIPKKKKKQPKKAASRKKRQKSDKD